MPRASWVRVRPYPNGDQLTTLCSPTSGYLGRGWFLVDTPESFTATAEAIGLQTSREGEPPRPSPKERARLQDWLQLTR